MCELAGVSRASFYRHWEAREPAAAETELRGAIQRLAVAHRYYGYRRIAVLLPDLTAWLAQIPGRA